MAEYDKIAKQYTSKASIHQIYAIDPTFYDVLGDVKGLTVLDVGCGNGYFTEKIKEKGAAKVIGVDISSAMLELAIERERINKLDISYLQHDAIKMPKIGDFDIVTCTFLFHYSKTKDELFSMVKNCFANLKGRGRLIAINHNPDHPTFKDERFDSCVSAPREPIEEGDGLIVSILGKDKKPICQFTNYFWKKETYNNLFFNAGFKKIKWHGLKVSEEGIKLYGKEAWKGYEEKSNIIIIECFK